MIDQIVALHADSAFDRNSFWVFPTYATVLMAFSSICKLHPQGHHDGQPANQLHPQGHHASRSQLHPQGHHDGWYLADYAHLEEEQREQLQWEAKKIYGVYIWVYSQCFRTAVLVTRNTILSQVLVR